jgi:hypothetical protein
VRRSTIVIIIHVKLIVALKSLGEWGNEVYKYKKHLSNIIGVAIVIEQKTAIKNTWIAKMKHL